MNCILVGSRSHRRETAEFDAAHFAVIRSIGCVIGVAIAVTAALSHAGDERSAKPGGRAEFDAVGVEFTRDARPVLKQFCLKCHSTKEQKGDLDLERFGTLADVRKETKTWLKVVEMLDNGEMPPKEAQSSFAGTIQRAARLDRPVSAGRGVRRGGGSGSRRFEAAQ